MFGLEHLAQHLHHSEMRRKELEEDMAPLRSDDTYESAQQEFARAVSDAESRGLIPLANEHWFNVLTVDLVLALIRGQIDEPSQLGLNPTFIPKDIFDTLSPIFLIRHPALSVNSIYRDCLKFSKSRPGDEDFELITSNKHNRLLFDYFTGQGRQPIVVDAEDILWRTEDMTRNLCTALGGINPQGLSDKWEPTSQAIIDRMNPLVYMITKDIQDSCGIERPDAKPNEPKIEVTFDDWTKKYGGAVAEQLKALADDNMPHYEYMKQFKI